MRLAPRLLLGCFLLAPIDLHAQAGELAYCTTLYDLAVKYRGRQINGESIRHPGSSHGASFMQTKTYADGMTIAPHTVVDLPAITVF